MVAKYQPELFFVVVGQQVPLSMQSTHTHCTLDDEYVELYGKRWRQLYELGANSDVLVIDAVWRATGFQVRTTAAWYSFARHSHVNVCTLSAATLVLLPPSSSRIVAYTHSYTHKMKGRGSITTLCTA